MKNKTYHTVRTIPKSNWKIVKTDKIGISNTFTFNAWTGTSIKDGGVKLLQWTQTSPLSKMTRSCKCSPHVIKMLSLTLYNTSNLEHYS